MDCTQQDVVLPWHASPTLPAFPRSHSKNCGFHPDLPRMERNLWGRSWLSVFNKPLLRSAIERYFAEERRERERHWHATASQRPTFHSCGHVPECRERETKVSRQRGWEDEVSALPYPNYYIFDQEMVGMLSDAAELRMDPSANMILYLPTSK